MSNTLAEPFNSRFPGQYYDAESGLHYNRFRTYDPSIGRYISADPIGQIGGINLFVYASNLPTVRADPLGLLDPYTGSGQAILGAADRAADLASALASASQQAAANAACAAGSVLNNTLGGAFGLGFAGDIGTASTFGLAGALSFGGAGAAFTGLGSAGGVASAGVLGTGATLAAASVAAGTGVYLTALAATTYVNAVSNAFGTNFASFSNTGPFQALFPDVTGAPGLSALGGGSGIGPCGCQ